MTVVVIGDANVDLELRLPDGASRALHSNPEPRLFGGGSAANTAAALARLGVETRFVGTVGEDAHGRFAVSSLAAAGVNTEFVDTTTAAPTVMVIFAVQPDGERLVYVWPPRGGAFSAVRRDVAIEALDAADWLHVSGLCMRTSPSREAAVGAMRDARRRNVPVSFDLNLRLETWGWEGDFKEFVQGAIEHADIVMGNGPEEIVPLAGIDDVVGAALAIAGATRLVIARDGASGSVACTHESVVRSVGFPVDVEDTMGAGDAFNAGFIAARLAGSSPQDSLRLGNAVGALSVTRPGARHTPTLADTLHFLNSH